MPLISVCIPAYNRAKELPELLESIFLQNFTDFEIVICEDKSPQRSEIAKIVRQFKKVKPGFIRYFENSNNLGYDGNLRNLISKSKGDFCLFMGNDDLLFDNALSKVASAVKRHKNIGVVLRSYASFVNSKSNILETFRYFDREIFFPSGNETIGTIYRRSVVISGLTLSRKESIKWSTNVFDGTLLYQLYLIANILADKNAVFVPDIISLYRIGGVPDFGNSISEKSKFTPKEQTADSSFHFIKGMLEIAKFVEKKRQVKIYKRILKDIAIYSYPILSIQSKRSIWVFIRYFHSLGRLGLYRYFLYYFWFFLLLVFGRKFIDYIIIKVKYFLGYTPVLGGIYLGEKK